MIKLEDGYFNDPRPGDCCFGVGIINWLKLHDKPVDAEALYKRYEQSPYTVLGGGTDLLLFVKQLEYVTEGEYTGRLYHCVCDGGQNLEDKLANYPVSDRDFLLSTFKEEIESGRLIHSVDDMRRLVLNPNSDLRGVIASIFKPTDADKQYIVAHTIVSLNPLLYPRGSFIDSTGIMYQFEDDEITQYAGVLEIIEN